MALARRRVRNNPPNAGLKGRGVTRPLKYAKAVGEKLFKATGMLIPGGILIAGVFAVGMEFATGTLAMLAGGSVGSGEVDAAFQGGSSVHPLLAAAMPLMAVTAMNLVAITYVVKWLSGAMGGAASAMTGKAKSAMKGGASKASGAVSGGAGGGMVGGMMGGGDQTAVNNQFAGGPTPAASAAGGGGGRDDEGQSQTVNDTAPDLEQSSLDQYGEGGLGDGDRQEYAEPSTGEEYEEPDGDSEESTELSDEQEKRLNQLESEVDSADSEDDPAESYTPGELTVDEAKSMTDNEEMAKTMVAMDQKMASLSEPDESTAMGQEAAKGAVAGAAGAGAGQTVGAALGGIGGSIAGPVGTAAGAALGGAIGGAAGGIGGYAASRMVGEGSVRGGLERVSEATSGVKSKAKETYSYALPGGSGEGESGGGESVGFEGDDYA